MATNAALSSEQRQPPNWNYCAVNTKFKAKRKCQALRICLKRFVRRTSNCEYRTLLVRNHNDHCE
ncbi:hypothetical protein FOB75_02715 [Vibrio parahaemolyticus]|nr:hypothetical protein FOB75_02715 [Vibrio parahaemolyticus]